MYARVRVHGGGWADLMERAGHEEQRLFCVLILVSPCRRVALADIKVFSPSWA